MHISIPTVLSSLLLLLAPLSAASSILTISIPPSAHLQNPNSLPASTHATLTSISLPNGPLKAPLTRSSTLVFNDLPPSSPGQDAPATRSYLLDIHSREYVFVPYRVDVDAQGNVVGVWETYRGHPWDNKGVEKMTVTEELDGSKAGVQNVVVEARVVGKRTFYEERQKFSPLSLFKNPMILLGVFALAMTVGMPYLLDQMDPEMREEFDKQRSAGIMGKPTGSGGNGGGNNNNNQGNAASQGFDLAGWMAGTSPGFLDQARATAQENVAAPNRRRG